MTPPILRLPYIHGTYTEHPIQGVPFRHYLFAGLAFSAEWPATWFHVDGGFRKCECRTLITSLVKEKHMKGFHLSNARLVILGVTMLPVQDMYTLLFEFLLWEG